jgi:CHAT domain-containing protein/Tfp pilus assembly protein PilF
MPPTNLRLGALLIIVLSLTLCPPTFSQDDSPGPLSQYASELFADGRYKELVPIAERLFEILKKRLGPTDSETGNAENLLAAAYYFTGECGKAIPLFIELIKIEKKAMGKKSENVATLLSSLGSSYYQIGDFTNAMANLNKSAETWQAQPDQNNPGFAATLNKLSLLYMDMANYSKAARVLKQASNIWKELGTTKDVTMAETLSNLGMLYYRLGDFDKSDQSLRQALDMTQSIFPPGHPAIAAIFEDFGVLKTEMGDYANAGGWIQQALDIWTAAIGAESPQVATSRVALGHLSVCQRDYNKAEHLFTEALRFYRSNLGAENPATVRTVNELGSLYFEMGDFQKAKTQMQQVLEIRERQLGPKHPDTGVSLNNVADVDAHLGDFEEAERLYQKAVDIWRDPTLEEHPIAAVIFNNVAALKFDLGKMHEAQIFATLASKAYFVNFANVLAFGSEQQRLAYENKPYPYSLLPDLKDNDEVIASAVLKSKGIVLDSVIEDRLVAEAGGHDENRDMVQRLIDDRRKLGDLLLQTTKAVSPDTAKSIADIKQDADQIESGLARHVSGIGGVRRSMTTSIEQVQKAIPQKGVLIEYLEYGHYLGKGRWAQRYGAVVLRRSGSPRWIPCCEASELDSCVSDYKRLVRDPSTEDRLADNLQHLYKLLLHPLELSLRHGVRTLLISPDGQINFISFATLLSSRSKFLAEDYCVQYVASGRDLLRKLAPRQSRSVVIFANPDFYWASEQSVPDQQKRFTVATEAVLGNERGSLSGVSTFPLTGTRVEARELKSSFALWQLKATSYENENATKKQLSETRSPYILHLATHGFFMTRGNQERHEVKQSPEEYAAFLHSEYFENPMHRSGLVLAGAANTLTAWKNGVGSDFIANDGIVTAEDVAALDLSGTWVVTLSACDTGSGDVKAGEGVIGLRRGFAQGGTQNLLMTLWGIPDEQSTVEFMKDFYESAHRIGSAPLALDEVQRQWLVALYSGSGKIPSGVRGRGLFTAVNLAGPFIMSFQGPASSDKQ